LIIGTGASVWSQDGDPGEGAKKQDQGAEKAPVRRGPVGISVDATSEVSGQVAERDADQAARELRFAKYMTGAKFIGRFTLRGQEGGELPKEEYTIVKCEKLDKPNMFRFTARIQYGDIDTEVPMELPVVWAGDTPVISLTNLWIPGLGTFSSRVVVYQGAYAGTWSHGEKGGHLFGMIESDGTTKKGPPCP
jgi:hypothetical protein